MDDIVAHLVRCYNHTSFHRKCVSTLRRNYIDTVLSEARIEPYTPTPSVETLLSKRDWPTALMNRRLQPAAFSTLSTLFYFNSYLGINLLNGPVVVYEHANSLLDITLTLTTITCGEVVFKRHC